MTLLEWIESFKKQFKSIELTAEVEKARISLRLKRINNEISLHNLEYMKADCQKIYIVRWEK